MLYPNTNCEEWATRYGLTIKELICLCCNEKFLTTTPVAVQGYRGLQTPEHACGKEYVAGVFIPVEKEEINFWIDIKYGT